MFNELDSAGETGRTLRRTKLAGAERTELLGFMARALVQMTIPHRATSELYFQRRNGKLTLTMVGHPEHGLPYGKIPRLLLAWIARRVRITQSEMLKLSPIKAELFRDLGLTASGGRNGPIKAVDDQLLRLLKCTVHIDRQSDERADWKPFQLSSGMSLWKDGISRDASDFWIQVSPEFFREVTTNAVPLNFATLQALRSPLAIDIYAWATDRVYRLSRPTVIKWPELRSQFGAEYQRPQDFRRAFERALGVTSQ